MTRIEKTFAWKAAVTGGFRLIEINNNHNTIVIQWIASREAETVLSQMHYSELRRKAGSTSTFYRVIRGADEQSVAVEQRLTCMSREEFLKCRIKGAINVQA